jgi:hypothetical protein
MGLVGVPCLLSGAAPAASAAIGIKPAAQLRLPFGRVAGVGPLQMLAPAGSDRGHGNSCGGGGHRCCGATVEVSPGRNSRRLGRRCWRPAMILSRRWPYLSPAWRGREGSAASGGTDVGPLSPMVLGNPGVCWAKPATGRAIGHGRRERAALSWQRAWPRVRGCCGSFPPPCPGWLRRRNLAPRSAGPRRCCSAKHSFPQAASLCLCRQVRMLPMRLRPGAHMPNSWTIRDRSSPACTAHRRARSICWRQRHCGPACALIPMSYTRRFSSLPPAASPGTNGPRSSSAVRSVRTPSAYQPSSV